MKASLRTSAIAAVLLLVASAGYPQNFPAKPIRIIAPAAGGGIDFVARVVASALSAYLGQQVVVENRGGGGGVVAVQAVVSAKPDGYTLLCYGPPAWINPLIMKVPYDPQRDLTPVGVMARNANLLVVHPLVKAQTAGELIQLAKERPGELLDAGSDTGSSAHLAAELFKFMAKVSIRRVPYKGVGQGLIGLTTGEVQMMIPVISAAMPHVRSQRLRVLGVSTPEPTTLAPGVPTIASTGLPGYAAESQNAMFAPAGTPPEIVAKLNQALNHILALPEVRERLLASGSEPAGGTAQAAAQIIKAEMVKWGNLVKELGIRGD